MNQKDKFECFHAFVVDKVVKGVTKQTALAKHIGCSNSTLHHLVKGDCQKFRLTWQKKAAAFFGLSLADLIKAGERIILTENQHDDGETRREIHIHIHLVGGAEHVISA